MDTLYNEREAAPQIGVKPSTLKQARHTGVLFGKPGPSFLKMGRTVRYKLSELVKFREQFPHYQNTSEIEKVPEEGSE
jgi:hypothetical protein